MALRVELEELLDKLDRAYNRLYQRDYRAKQREEKAAKAAEQPEFIAEPPPRPRPKPLESRIADELSAANGESALDLRRRIAGY